MSAQSATIAAFEEECKQYPAQYTPDWFARALTSIGGSEMHDLETAPRALASRKIARVIEAENTPAPTLAISPIIELSLPIPAFDACAQIATSSNVIGDDDEVAPAAAPNTQPRESTSSNVIDDDDAPAPAPAPTDDITVLIDPSCEAQPEPKSLMCALPEEVAQPAQLAKDSIGEFAMGWGTLFEPLLCEFIARTLHVDIRCRSVSYFNGVWRYSPDGTFVDASGKCALLEMKNPALRIWPGFFDNPHSLTDPSALTSNPSDIPPHYLPQLQAGMRLMTFTEYALYVEAIYRRASLPGGTYSTGVGRQKMTGGKGADGALRNLRDIPRMDAGVIGFYHSSRAIPPINFGSRNNDEQLMHAIANQRCADPFVPAYFAANGEPFRARSELPLMSGDLHLYGYMPWNLIGVHSERVDREPSPISSTLDEDAQFVIDAVRECQNAPRERVEATLARVHAAAISAHDPSRVMNEIEANIKKCASYYASRASA